MDKPRARSGRLLPALMGVVLAYVLVVQALVAPLHALAGVPLQADRSLALVCSSHSTTDVDVGQSGHQPEHDCCDLGCAAASVSFPSPVAGAGSLVLPPLVLGRSMLVLARSDGARPPDWIGGQRHGPRAPPVSFAVI